MVDLSNVLTAQGAELGSAGRGLLTGAGPSSGGSNGLRQILLDIADDMEGINVQEALGLTLLFTTARIGASYGDAGSGVVPGGQSEPAILRGFLKDIAIDLDAINTAGPGAVQTHTLDRIPLDFLSGGSGMIPPRREADMSLDVAAPGSYQFFAQALQAIAIDLEAIKTIIGGALVLKTISATW